MDSVEIGLSHLFYVKLKKEQDIILLNELAKTKNVKIIGQNDFMPLWFTLSCSKESDGNALQMANYFYETGLFVASEPDFLVDDLIHNPNYTDQWGLNNTGQCGGTVGLDIKAPQAWNITKGQNVTVAVLDHGIELNHPDLLNMSPLSFDTESNTSPSLVLGNHGTACAGIIGAADNSIGSVGVASNCTLMSISNSLSGTPNSRQVRANGINFAWQNGADIISNSWGSAVQYQIIDDAIDNALNQGRNGLGCVIVFSSGNNNSNVSYPANSNPDILAVGAMNQCGQRKSPTSCDTETAWGSNFGNELDIVAPGVLISTTDRQSNNGYNPNLPIHNLAGGTLVSSDYSDRDYTRWFNGTSSACPHVSGVAALVLSVNPNLTVQEVNNIIENTAQKVGGYTYSNNSSRPNGTWNNEMGYGLVDAYAAVRAAANITGSDIVCSSNSTFNLHGTINPVWSKSYNLSLVSSNSNSITVKAINSNVGSSGYVCATLPDGTYIQKDFWVGKANVDYVSFTNGIGESGYFCTSHYDNKYYLYPSLPNNVGTVTHQIRIRKYPNLNIVYQPSQIFTGNQGTLNYYPSPGWYLFEVKRTNSCGVSQWFGFEVEFVDCSLGGGGGEEEFEFLAYPNPSSETIFLQKNSTETTSLQKSTIEFKLFDLNSSLITKDYIFNGKASIDVSKLKKGKYILKIYGIKEEEETHYIIVN